MASSATESPNDPQASDQEPFSVYISSDVKNYLNDLKLAYTNQLTQADQLATNRKFKEAK
jgi:hypothetical protein